MGTPNSLTVKIKKKVTELAKLLTTALFSRNKLSNVMSCEMVLSYTPQHLMGSLVLFICTADG